MEKKLELNDSGNDEDLDSDQLNFELITNGAANLLGTNSISLSLRNQFEDEDEANDTNNNTNSDEEKKRIPLNPSSQQQQQRSSPRKRSQNTSKSGTNTTSYTIQYSRRQLDSLNRNRLNHNRINNNNNNNINNNNNNINRRTNSITNSSRSSCKRAPLSIAADPLTEQIALLSSFNSSIRFEQPSSDLINILPNEGRSLYLSLSLHYSKLIIQ